MIVAAFLTAFIPIPVPRPSQPVPSNVWVQSTPQNEAPSRDTNNGSSVKQNQKVSLVSQTSGINGQTHTAENHYAGGTKSPHDFFDYLGLFLPFIVGVATVVVLILQLHLLRRADRIAILDAKIANRQMRISGALADIAVAQKEIARKAYLATHRPKITFRALKPDIENSLNGRYFVEIIVLNEGESPAKVSEIGTRAFAGPGPWTYGARKIQFDVDKTDITLIGGQTEKILTKSRYPMIETDIVPSKDRGIYWFCVGYVKYRGDGDTFDRGAGFCRVWDFKSMTWERWPSEEHEYAY